MFKTTITLFLFISATVCFSESSTHIDTISDRYLELDLALQYDALADMYAENVLFSDPSGDVFGPPLADGPVVGRENVIAMQKSWGLGWMEFTESTKFVVGEYTVRFGEAGVAYKGSERRYHFPFLTIHRIAGGQLSERHDFGGYVGNLIGGEDLIEKSSETLSLSRNLLNAYLDGDLSTQARLYAENIWFQDPTAAVYGDEMGKAVSGRELLMNKRRDLYTRITDFQFDIDREFASNHHAVFAGHISYVYGEKYRFVQPAVMVFEVIEGRVTRHWDFVDYTVQPTNVEL